MLFKFINERELNIFLECEVSKNGKDVFFKSDIGCIKVSSNSINLLANAVTIAYKRGVYTKEETVIINKCFKTLTTHPSKWN